MTYFNQKNPKLNGFSVNLGFENDSKKGSTFSKASYGWGGRYSFPSHRFYGLVLLILASQRIEDVIGWEIKTDATKRGSPPSLVESCILAWVAGIVLVTQRITVKSLQLQRIITNTNLNIDFL